MNNKKFSIGLAIFRYAQILLSISSLFIFLLFLILEPRISFWLLAVTIWIAITLYWFSFSDIEYNKEKFIIKRMFYKKEIPVSEFTSVDSVFQNYFIIKFRTNRYYFVGTFFDTPEKFIKSIKLIINRID